LGSSSVFEWPCCVCQQTRLGPGPRQRRRQVQEEGSLPSKRSGEGGAKRRSAQAKRGRLGCLLRAPEAEPLPCLFASFTRTNSRPRLFLSSGQLLLFLGSHRVGNRAAFSDSRSNFHTRVGYRTNVCRRRLASDSARASEELRPKGLSRITMTGRPVPHPRRWSSSTQAVIGALIS
jgi:hypothetical protein